MLERQSPTSPSPRLRWRERALRETRRRMYLLQIELHRVKADLARLESANETDLADELAAELGLESRDVALGAQTIQATNPRQAGAQRVNLSGLLARNAQTQTRPAPAIKAAEKSSAIQPAARPTPRRRKRRSLAWLWSLGIHALALLFLAPLSYVILTNERMPLITSMFGPELSEVADPGTGPIELVSFEEEFESPGDVVDVVADLPAFNTDDFGPLENELGGETAAQFGQLNSLPTDVGTLMAGGAAGPGQGLGGGGSRAAGDEARLGEINFFGTPARANRVVFLVDNSGSMKQGRMETTLLELARSVEALGEKQEFYVVFYSDQAYPLFYPHSEMNAIAATRENKQRLFQWLQTIELCTGGALLKAVEIAESLDPQVVYVLSDGNITSRRTLEQLTQPGVRKFALHTLGMGVAKPQDAQNLAAIALAHHGTFQMVRPLPAAVQMAKARPIRSNPFGVAWGAGMPLPLPVR